MSIIHGTCILDLIVFVILHEIGLVFELNESNMIYLHAIPVYALTRCRDYRRFGALWLTSCNLDVIHTIVCLWLARFKLHEFMPQTLPAGPFRRNPTETETIVGLLLDKTSKVYARTDASRSYAASFLTGGPWSRLTRHDHTPRAFWRGDYGQVASKFSPVVQCEADSNHQHGATRHHAETRGWMIPDSRVPIIHRERSGGETIAKLPRSNRQRDHAAAPPCRDYRWMIPAGPVFVPTPLSRRESFLESVIDLVSHELLNLLPKLLDSTVALERGFMHANVLRIEGISSPASSIQFIAYENGVL
ncbi:hypothetical protein B0H11DRAFT_1927763 [Mycena galericulata]|nr:hypothetical protein B0H11DRAFT_1927763 [Mycena galericulata]